MNNSKEVAPISAGSSDAGYVVALVGRTALRDVAGFPGFPLIRSGETVTREIAERALKMGRLFELTSATEPT